MQKNTLFSNQTVTPMAVNSAGGKAYTNSFETELARVVCTSFFGGTYYTEGADQLTRMVELAGKCSPEFVAACAIYARQVSSMKDTPVALLLCLRTNKKELYKQAFPRVINDPRVLRGLVQMIRSGKFGSRSLGTCTRKLINKWFDKHSPLSVWNMSIGSNPTMRDVMRLSRPSPNGDKEREAVYKLIVRNERTPELPQEIKEFYSFIANQELAMPKVNFQRLTSIDLTPENWSILGQNMTWSQLRQNINTLERHSVFTNPVVASKLAAKISDQNEVNRSKVFPYQLYTTLLNITDTRMKNAVQTALDYSVANIPTLPENTVVALDVSGSMSASVNGQNVNGGLSCSQVGALLAAAIYKKNPNTRVLTFTTTAKDHTGNLNAHDSLMTNIGKISFAVGGTDCSQPMQFVANHKIPCDLFVLISDNESWAGYQPSRGVTATKLAWNKVKQLNPRAKCVCMDLAPRSTSQLPEASDTLFLAGFKDNLFTVMNKWLIDSNQNFVKEIMDYSNNLN